MSKRAIGVIWVLVMVGVIVAIDVLFLRGSQETGTRLGVNVALVVVFLGLFFALVRHRN